MEATRLNEEVGQLKAHQRGRARCCVEEANSGSAGGGFVPLRSRNTRSLYLDG